MNKISRPLVIAVAMACSGSVFATNGYWSHGYGPKAKSMAGASVAMVIGPMNAAANPATLALTGNQLEFGASVFTPDRGYTAHDNGSPPPYPSMNAGEYVSSNKMFVIPHIAYNTMLNDNSSFGISVGANGGLNTDYDSAVFAGFGAGTAPTGIDMKQMLVGLTYSHKLNQQHSFGITPIIAMQTMNVQGLQAFQGFSVHPDKVTNNGTDMSFGGGLKLGWLWQVNDKLNIGASYQSRLYMSEFDDYAGLLAEQGGFDIPPNMDLGLAYKVLPDITLAFNMQRIEFSKVNSIGNASDLAFMPGSPPMLGTDDGLGFGWDDINIYKVGMQWEYDSDLTFRAGYSFSDDAVTSSQALFNILTPAVVKHHYTIGVGKKLDKDSELNLSFMYAPEEVLQGTNPNTGLQTGTLQMSQWELEVGYSTSF